MSDNKYKSLEDIIRGISKPSYDLRAQRKIKIIDENNVNEGAKDTEFQASRDMRVHASAPAEKKFKVIHKTTGKVRGVYNNAKDAVAHHHALSDKTDHKVVIETKEYEIEADEERMLDEAAAEETLVLDETVKISMPHFDALHKDFQKHDAKNYGILVHKIGVKRTEEHLSNLKKERSSLAKDHPKLAAGLHDNAIRSLKSAHRVFVNNSNLEQEKQNMQAHAADQNEETNLAELSQEKLKDYSSAAKKDKGIANLMAKNTGKKFWKDIADKRESGIKRAEGKLKEEVEVDESYRTRSADTKVVLQLGTGKAGDAPHPFWKKERARYIKVGENPVGNREEKPLPSSIGVTTPGQAKINSAKEMMNVGAEKPKNSKPKVTKEEADAPFDDAKKSPKEHKDEFGNKIKDKNIARHLARKGMALAMKSKKEKNEETNFVFQEIDAILEHLELTDEELQFFDEGIQKEPYWKTLTYLNHRIGKKYKAIDPTLQPHVNALIKQLKASEKAQKALERNPGKIKECYDDYEAFIDVEELDEAYVTSTRLHMPAYEAWQKHHKDSGGGSYFDYVERHGPKVAIKHINAMRREGSELVTKHRSYKVSMLHDRAARGLSQAIKHHTSKSSEEQK